MTFTLSEIANRIAQLEGRDAARVHAQLRNPAIRVLLKPIDKDRGKTTAVMFPREELIRARIASVLIDIGHDAATIAEALSPLDREIRPPYLGTTTPWPDSFATRGENGEVLGFTSPPALPAVIRGVRQGEIWELRVRFTRNHSGHRVVTSDLALGQWVRDDDDTLEKLDQSFEHTRLAELTIPLTPLIKPLLSELPEPEA
ncbi:hypothetical protein [Brevundimonas sp.]|uniref:hypothetical protein n=1 Tax=Brevundimonas sp. TaxID=1871086 RepID=UPI0026212976|nr:hypothetical protein [Brevundimonas sp.]